MRGVLPPENPIFARPYRTGMFGVGPLIDNSLTSDLFKENL